MITKIVMMLITLILLIVISTLIIQTFNEETNTIYSNETNIINSVSEGITTTLNSFFPIIIAVITLLTVSIILLTVFRFINGEELVEEEGEEPKIIPKKQTYLEYVIERKKIERMFNSE